MNVIQALEKASSEINNMARSKEAKHAGKLNRAVVDLRQIIRVLKTIPELADVDNWVRPLQDHEAGLYSDRGERNGS